MLRPYYRTYDLPWNRDYEEEVAFRKLWRSLLIATLILGFLIWLIDLPEPDITVKPAMPARLAKIVIEREPPPPPPPPPPPEVEEPPPELQPREVPREQPTPRPSARERAAQAGLLAFQDDLADLREQFDQTREQLKQVDPNAVVEGPTRSERSLITSKVGASSGGINTAAQSRGFGGGAGNLGGHTTGTVATPIGGGRGEGVRRTGSSGKAARTREEIELVFDRNKGAIYALYSRALRERPDLQGKMVLEFTIAPSGEVTMCRVVSSELGDPELERKIVARVRLFRFPEKDVETVTTTKPIDFFPA